jgi:hypothetical protein
MSKKGIEDDNTRLADPRQGREVEPDEGNTKTTGSASTSVTRIRVQTEPGEQEEDIHVHRPDDAQPEGEPGTGRAGKKVRKAKLSKKQADYLLNRELRDRDDETLAEPDRTAGEVLDDEMSQADSSVEENPAMKNFQSGYGVGYEEGKDDQRAVFNELLEDDVLPLRTLRRREAALIAGVAFFIGLVVGYLI